MAAYSRYCEGRSLFVATKAPKSIGHIVKFKIALAGGEHLMTGVGPVIETFDDRENRFGRPGMRVEVEKLDATGRHWMEQLRARSGAPGVSSPRVASAPTGMFAIVTDDQLPAASATAAPSAPVAAPSAPVAAPSAPVAAPAPVIAAPVPSAPVEPVVAAKPSPVPVPINDGLSAGWELDGLPNGLNLPPRPASGKSGSNGAVAGDKRGTAEVESGQPPAVVASGEVDVPLPLPPPPVVKGRSKRITFPALMFNKPRGLAVPAPTGAVVPKPLALLPSGPREGKLRPPTAPADREPAAPVAPLGTPADTEPHVMVPPELEQSIAKPHPSNGARDASHENHPDIADAPPEEVELSRADLVPAAASDPVVASAPHPGGPRRSRASTTTPPPVWTERTVTQTLHALVGGRPDPKVQEETVHWTNPGFAQLVRELPPQVDIVEEEEAETPPAAQVMVAVDVGHDPMDATVLSGHPLAGSRQWRMIAALVVTAAAAGLGGGYLLGLRSGLTIDKMPVAEVASAGAAPDPVKNPAWVVECSDRSGEQAAAAAPPRSEPVEETVESPAVAATHSPEISGTRSRPRTEPSSSSSSSSQSCYLNAMSSPVGAIVLVDGKAAGRTPLRSKVTCGRHGVRFEMKNYQTATRSFEARRGTTEKVSAELSRPRAVLRVESSPSGAAVSINGSTVGVTPLTTTVAGFVSSKVTLSKPGYKTITKQVSPTSTSARIGVSFQRDVAARPSPKTSSRR